MAQRALGTTFRRRLKLAIGNFAFRFWHHIYREYHVWLRKFAELRPWVFIRTSDDRIFHGQFFDYESTLHLKWAMVSDLNPVTDTALSDLYASYQATADKVAASKKRARRPAGQKNSKAP
jgi:hypothetical protein